MSAKYVLILQSYIQYLNSLESETDSGVISACHIFDAETKLSILETTWSKIGDAHDKLLNSKDLSLDLPYLKENTYSKITQRYAKIKGALKARINELEPRQVAHASLNASALEPAQARPHLPVIKPPTFNGDILQWQAFKIRFLSVVSQTGVNQIDKMHYLTQNLSGSAASLIANVDINDDAFDNAWATLTKRYENKRVLISAQLNRLFNIPKMTARSSKEVNSILNTTTEVLNALKSHGSPVEHWDQLIVHHIALRLDPQTREEWELALGASTEYPALDRLNNFLLSRARALESMEERTPPKTKDTKTEKRAPRGIKPSPAHVHAASASLPASTKGAGAPPQTQVSSGRAPRVSKPCSCCGESHFIVSCYNFHHLTPDARLQLVSSKALCFNCLGSHPVASCINKKRCLRCQAAHHTLLHDSMQTNANHVQTTNATTSGTPLPSTSLITTQQSRSSCHPATSPRPTVLLATAQASLITPAGLAHPVRLLLDPGSELTLISQELVHAHNLRISTVYIPIVGVGSVSSGYTRGAVDITLRSVCVDEAVELHAHILPKLTVELPARTIEPQTWPHLIGLNLADPGHLSPGKIDILVGSDSFGLILKPGVRRGDSDQPIAIQTLFGWAILGPVSTSAINSPSHLGHLITNSHLHELVSKFWEIEEVPSSQTDTLSAEEAACEAHFIATHSRDSQGRYIVRLPFKTDPSTMGNSKGIAHKSLSCLLKRLDNQPEVCTLYKEFLSEYASMGHMEEVTDLTASLDGYYLPHHGVLRNGKIRVVFNGSCKTTSGTSLNDLLHTGPKTQNDIFVVLLYVRRFQFIFTTDIVKMFRQIAMHPDDRKYQRILWTDGSAQPKVYDLTTVTYGTTPAPYLAGRTIKQLVLDEGHQFPRAIEPLTAGSYVDDISGGADTLTDLNEIATQVEQMCLKGCLPLAKWKSNHPDFIQLQSSSMSSSESHEFNYSSTKILGLAWQCASDQFTFTDHNHHRAAITKRTILSETAQLFDPLGLISPIIVRAKILMQDLWLEKIGWDDTLTPQLQHRWATFRDELYQLSSLTIPRWLHLSTDVTLVELHGFSDASQAAMAAAVYVRVSKSIKSAQVTLVCSKTRVAPLKRLTIPRLELSAALLLANLVSSVQEVLKLQEVPVTLWTDSAVSLAWINSDPMRWKEFVKNRVQEIQRTMPKADWKFISGKDNPADCASRGVTPSQLIAHKLWWTGPDWLALEHHQWPNYQASDNNSADMECRPSAVHVSAASPHLPFESLLEHSSLTKLLRRTATIMRAAAVFKKTPSSNLRVSPLTPADLSSALTFWIRKFQQSYFASEFRAFTLGKALAKSHPFTRLTARVDQTGLIRVGGRLQNSQLDEDAKHPPILPKDCLLSSLIIANAHSRTLHGGTQLTLNYVRKYCWILGGRAPIKSYIHRCVTCTRIRGIRATQLMGQLPATRVSPSLTFEHSGVDYAGPVSLKFFQGRGTRCYKAWIAIFVCFSTSAVHLELVTDYSSDGFLKAFRRFTARRGICKTLTSDCGTNFQGADTALKQLLAGSLQESQHLRHILSNDGTEWKFNPSGAPHMGGKWEAAVKSVKFHLQRTIADTLLTYEDFSTLLTQVEAVLNSRPLSALSEDPEDLSALTPGHFIRGAPLNTIPEPNLTDVPTNRLSRLQRIQERLQHFWERWTADCLQTHQTMSKWRTSRNDIKTGSLVLVTDERYSPTKWPLARVTATHPGSDGLTRVVTVKTATSSYTRPISKLVLLPVSTHDGDSRDADTSSS